MKLDKTLCWIAIGIAGLLGAIFLVDIASGAIFGRFGVSTEVCVIIASALIIWQGIETMREL